MTVEQLIANRTALAAALGSGTLSVRFADGRAVTYRSTAELIAAIEWHDREISRLTTGINGARVAVITAIPVRALRL